MSKIIENTMSCVEENKSVQTPPASKLASDSSKNVDSLPSDDGDLRKKIKSKEPTEESPDASFERPQQQL